jgi:hypothetical protein
VSRRKRRKGGERKEGRKEVVGQNIQNKSPSTDPASAFPSAPFAFFKIPHNQAGYSPSSNATGSFFPFTKFKPLSVVPAATELFTVGAAFSALLGAWREAAEGDALKGVEKGCAAPVDEAAGGVCEELSGLPVRGEAVERWVGVVVMARRKGRVVGRWIAVRRQRVQIIVCGYGGERLRSRFRGSAMRRLRLGQRFDGVGCAKTFGVLPRAEFGRLRFPILRSLLCEVHSSSYLKELSI